MLCTYQITKHYITKIHEALNMDTREARLTLRETFIIHTMYLQMCQMHILPNIAIYIITSFLIGLVADNPNWMAIHSGKPHDNILCISWHNLKEVSLINNLM